MGYKIHVCGHVINAIPVYGEEGTIETWDVDLPDELTDKGVIQALVCAFADVYADSTSRAPASDLYL